MSHTTSPASKFFKKFQEDTSTNKPSPNIQASALEAVLEALASRNNTSSNTNRGLNNLSELYKSNPAASSPKDPFAELCPFKTTNGQKKTAPAATKQPK